LLEAAAMLWAPAGGLSHHCAARREGIWVPDSSAVQISVPWEDKHRSRPGVDVMRTRHPPEWVTDGFMRWTPPSRTIVDLAALLNERMLSAVLLSAVRLKKATAAEVAAAANPLPGRAGLALLSRVVSLWTPERESLLEDGLYADVSAVAAGYVIERQWVVRSGSGDFLGRTDVGIPELKLAFEADGLFFHSSDAQIAADQQRDRRYLTAGWQTVRFREGPLADHANVQREIAGIIAGRRRRFAA
jgi:very-short-patch-repair endonuclease